MRSTQLGIGGVELLIGRRDVERGKERVRGGGKMWGLAKPGGAGAKLGGRGEARKLRGGRTRWKLRGQDDGGANEEMALTLRSLTP